jgi:DNA-binding Lrp family transcriptional regulator
LDPRGYPAEGTSTILHLGSDEEGAFEIDANIVATGRTCVIGASGSGKSYAVGVICEELCKSGVPFAIVDTEGEYSGLKQKYDVIWVGDEQGCDLQWSGLDPEKLGTQAPDLAPLVLDLSETDEPKQKVSDILSIIYGEVEKRRTPYLVIVEEADRFVPQNGEKVAIFGEIARRGRKRGVGLMVCTQRPSLVDKNVLSQCGNQLIGKLVIRNDLQAVAQFFQGREAPKQLTTLPPGRFYAMGGLSAVPRLVSIKEKETLHGGATPKLGPRVIKPFMASGPSSVPRVAKGAAATGTSLIGINPTFSEEDIPDIVKRDKAFIFFGSEETVSSARLVLRPMVELGVALRTGILRKRVGVRYIVLDGATAMFVDLDDVPAMYYGLGPVIGLTTEDIETLRETSADTDMGGLEIANKVGVSREALRRPLKLLEERRLIRSHQAGRSRLYRRVYDFPEFRWHEAGQVLEQFNAAGKAEQSLLSEAKLREVVKGLVPHSEVQEYREFVYPLYRVELVLGRKKRIVWLDGRTGKEFRP